MNKSNTDAINSIQKMKILGYAAGLLISVLGSINIYFLCEIWVSEYWSALCAFLYAIMIYVLYIKLLHWTFDGIVKSHRMGNK